MENDKPPSEHDNNNFISDSIATTDCKDLEKIIHAPDKQEILLEPEKDELAVLNCTMPVYKSVKWPKPFLYRIEYANPDPSPNSFYSFSKRIKEDICPFGRHSVIALRWLKSPIEFSDDKKRIIIFPTKEYEKLGCEDPRITFLNDTYYITYVAYDGINACVALATTKDFEKIKKHGIISPQIPLEEVINLVNDPEYTKIFQGRLNTPSFKWGKKRTLFPMDKDAFITQGFIKEFRLHHRIGKYMQIAEVDNLEEFTDKKQEFWKEYFKNIDNFTLMKNTDPWISDEWVNEKIGWGTQFFQLGDKNLEIWHGVNGKCEYSCSFLEERNGKIVAIMRDPLIKPTDEDTFFYKDDVGKVKTKKVRFVTAAIVDDKEEQIYLYYGSGDKRINYYATSAPWAYRELNHPSNRIELTAL